MRSKSNEHVYYKHDGGNFCVITLNVYDTLLFGNNKDVIFDLKSNLLVQFDMKGMAYKNIYLRNCDLER